MHIINRAMRSINLFIKSHCSWKVNSRVLVAALLLPGAWKPFSSENRESCFYHSLEHWQPVYTDEGSKVAVLILPMSSIFWSLNFVAAIKYPISIKVLSMRISLQYLYLAGVTLYQAFCCPQTFLLVKITPEIFFNYLYFSF